ncbi:MAG TPA: hypothetical protein VMV29_12845 [Ktedonobacterales bacterium]|nr:hypothetical protein [Ktedonobacterales bacterium]
MALERLAERGARAGGTAFEGELRDQAERMRQLGLTLCADALATLEHALAANHHRAAPDLAPNAEALLRCAHIIGLAHDNMITKRLLTTLGYPLDKLTMAPWWRASCRTRLQWTDARDGCATPRHTGV